MKPLDLKEVTNGLRKQGLLCGVFKSGVLTQLAFRGYPKSIKARFDTGSEMVNTVWILGVRERRAEAIVERRAEARVQGRAEARVQGSDEDDEDEACD